MKSLILVLFTLVSMPALADVVATSVVAPKGTIAVEHPQNLYVKDITPLCPERETCAKNGSVIEVGVGLGGCKDQIGPVSYTVLKVKEGSKTRSLVSINVIKYANEASARTRCAVEPHASFSITLIGTTVTEKDVVFVQ